MKCIKRNRENYLNKLGLRWTRLKKIVIVEVVVVVVVVVLINNHHRRTNHHIINPLIITLALKNRLTTRLRK
jgi:hypothetical protein